MAHTSGRPLIRECFEEVEIERGQWVFVVLGRGGPAAEAGLRARIWR